MFQPPVFLWHRLPIFFSEVETINFGKIAYFNDSSTYIYFFYYFGSSFYLLSWDVKFIFITVVEVRDDTCPVFLFRTFLPVTHGNYK